MFQHFHAADQIEFTGSLRGELLGGDQLIIDIQIAGLGVLASYRKRRLGEINAGHLRAGAGQALAEDAAAAAHVQGSQSLESASLLLNEAQPRNIDGVQGRHLTLRVPPLAGQCFELGNFARVDIGFRVLAHG